MKITLEYFNNKGSNIIGYEKEDIDFIPRLWEIIENRNIQDNYCKGVFMVYRISYKKTNGIFECIVSCRGVDETNLSNERYILKQLY